MVIGESFARRDDSPKDSHISPAPGVMHEQNIAQFKMASESRVTGSDTV